jgi:hypothetical protein
MPELRRRGRQVHAWACRDQTRESSECVFEASHKERRIMSTRLTSTQRAALMKLIDGKWHDLSEFSASTRRHLIDSGLIAYRTAPSAQTSIAFEYRLIDTGRIALGRMP